MANIPAHVKGKGRARSPPAPEYEDGSAVTFPSKVNCAMGKDCINARAKYTQWQAELDAQVDPLKRRAMLEGAGQSAPKPPIKGYEVRTVTALREYADGFLGCGHWCCPFADKQVADRAVEDVSRFPHGVTCALLHSRTASYKCSARGELYLGELVALAQAHGHTAPTKKYKVHVHDPDKTYRYTGEVRMIASGQVCDVVLCQKLLTHCQNSTTHTVVLCCDRNS